MMTEASGAEGIKRAATSGNKSVGRLIDTLDSYSIDIGKTHISLWDALVVAIVVVGIIVVAQLVSRFSGYLLKRIKGLDDAQRLLADKLATIGVVYSVSMILLLTAIGSIVFRESLNAAEVVGILMAVSSLVLLMRFA